MYNDILILQAPLDDGAFTKADVHRLLDRFKSVCRPDEMFIPVCVAEDNTQLFGFIPEGLYDEIGLTVDIEAELTKIAAGNIVSDDNIYVIGGQRFEIQGSYIQNPTHSESEHYATIVNLLTDRGVEDAEAVTDMIFDELY